jgi:dihydroorotate dehydrogenase electron transfer subunit
VLGPTPFMRTVKRFAKAYGARAQLSLENRMACGVGACLGCVTKDGAGRHVQVCTRGPVFWADKVEL